MLRLKSEYNACVYVNPNRCSYHRHQSTALLLKTTLPTTTDPCMLAMLPAYMNRSWRLAVTSSKPEKGQLLNVMQRKQTNI